MREHNEDWKKQLNTVIIEIVGLGEVFAELSPTILTLLCKLEGLLKRDDVPFDFYRKTVFESLNLLQGLKQDYANQQ